MQPLVSSVATALCAITLGAGSAQTLNLFEIYPDAASTSTTFTSRGNLNTSAGELLQEIPVSHFAQVGDATAGGGAPTAHAFRLFTQDENSNTRELYSVLFRREKSGGGIDTTAAGIVFQSGLIMTPPRSPAGPIEAWDITITFAMPVTIPKNVNWYLGVSLSAAPGWSAGTDGQSMHAAAYPPAGPTGDLPRAGAPAHSFNILAGTATPTPTGRCWNVGFLTPAAVLNMGGRAPGNTRQAAPPDNFGGGGLYPDPAAFTAGRFDDLVARTRDRVLANGFSILYLSAGRGPGVGIPGVPGTFSLNPAVLFQVGIAALDANGEGKLLISLGPGPSAVRSSLVGLTLYFQAIDVDATVAQHRLTNESDVKL